MPVSNTDSILALDLATRCGYAYANREGRLHAGTWNFSPKPGDRPGRRFIAFQVRLDALIAMRPSFSFVVYERVRFSTNDMADVIWCGFLAAMQMWCDRRNIPYEGVPVSTLKKYATGNGRAKKPEMIAAAKARGWSVSDDNQADAAWLFDYAKTKLRKGART